MQAQRKDQLVPNLTNSMKNLNVQRRSHLQNNRQSQYVFKNRTIALFDFSRKSSQIPAREPQILSVPPKAETQIQEPEEKLSKVKFVIGKKEEEKHAVSEEEAPKEVEISIKPWHELPSEKPNLFEFNFRPDVVTAVSSKSQKYESDLELVRKTFKQLQDRFSTSSQDHNQLYKSFSLLASSKNQLEAQDSKLISNLAYLLVLSESTCIQKLSLNLIRQDLQNGDELFQVILRVLKGEGEYMPMVSLFRLQYAQVTQITHVILTLMQDSAFYMGLKEDGQAEIYAKIAETCDRVVDWLFKQGQQQLLLTIVEDMCTLISSNGAALEYPIMGPFVKALSHQLFQIGVDSNEISRAEQIFVIEIMEKLLITLHGVDKIAKKGCYCGNHQKASGQTITCIICKTKYHGKCIFLGSKSADEFECLHCGDQSLEDQFLIMKNFYDTYQSIYQDFTSVKYFVYLQMFNIDNKNSQILQELQSMASDHKNSQSQREFSNTLMHPDFARECLAKTFGWKAIFESLLNVLQLQCFSKQATIRLKTIKIIKNLIKIDPQTMLQDDKIEQILQLRIQDQSSLTRECALDIINKNLQYVLLTKPKYLDMVIDRAQKDKNLTVRKKVIQILSQALNQNETSSSIRTHIIKILVSKWNDTSSKIRNSLIQSIQKSISYELIVDIMRQIKDDEELIRDVFEQVLSDKYRKYVRDFIEEAMGNTVKGDEEHLLILRVLGSIEPSLLREQVNQLIIIVKPFLDSNTAQKNVIQILIAMFSNLEGDDLQLDWLSKNNAQFFLNYSFQGLKNIKLANVKMAMTLLNEVTSVLKNGLCMKVMIEDLLNNKIVQAENSDYENWLRILRSAHILTECTYLDKLELGMQIPIKDELLSQIQEILKKKDQNPLYFDVGLEAISHVWLKYPEKLIGDKEIFKIISKKMTQKSMGDDTRVAVIRNFTNFLSDWAKDDMKSINFLNENLQVCLQFLTTPNSNLRIEVCKLFRQMVRLGMIETEKALESFILMQSDTQPEIVCLSTMWLGDFSQENRTIIQTKLMGIKQILDKIFDYQEQIIIGDEISGFQRMRQMQSDIGILDFLVNNCCTKQIGANIVNHLVRIGITGQIDDLHRIKAYGEILLSLLRNTPVPEDIIKTYEITNETLIYSKLKQENKTPKIINDALILFIVKLCGLSDFKQSIHYLETLFQYEDEDFNTELLCNLKMFVKAKDQKLKKKINKQLKKISTGNAANKKRRGRNTFGGNDDMPHDLKKLKFHPN